VAVETDGQPVSTRHPTPPLLFVFLLFPLPAESEMTIKKADEAKK
jgi:hypothetical protein